MPDAGRGAADPAEADTISQTELFEDGQVLQSDEPNASERRWEPTVSPAAGKDHYFLKVTQADGQKLWSAPSWVTVG